MYPERHTDHDAMHVVHEPLLTAYDRQSLIRDQFYNNQGNVCGQP